MKKRLRIGLTAILILLIGVVGLGAWYVREMRRVNRERQYAELRANSRDQIKVTIPEGWRREQIAALLQKDAVTMAADFLDATKNDEGHLFPDTYFFYAATPANTVRDKMLAVYKQRVANTDTNTLIIASIVEREAGNASDRPKIAGVYWNRYRLGMALDADPTVQYAKDTNNLNQALKGVTKPTDYATTLRNFKFWSMITLADYNNVQSSYNTYLQAGMPPGPICNPGVASIEAAQNPTQHSYLYFFTTSDGAAVYSKTLDEHTKNKAKYLY